MGVKYDYILDALRVSDESSSSWGSITGTLSAQTDLQTALNGKYSTSNPSGYITSSSLSAYWKKDGSSTPATGNWELGDNIFYVGAQTGGPVAQTDSPYSTSFTTTYKPIQPGSISGQEANYNDNINDQYGDGNIYDIYNNNIGYIDYTTGVYTDYSGDTINIINYTQNVPINHKVILDFNSGGKVFIGSGSGDTYYNENNGATFTINGQGKQGWLNIATNDGTNGSSAGIGYDDGKFKFGNNDWVGFNASVQGAGTRYFEIYANSGINYKVHLSDDVLLLQFNKTDIRGGIYDTTNSTGFGSSGQVLTSNGSGWSWQTAGGSQTPWTSNIDANGYVLIDNHVSGSNSLQLDDGGGNLNISSSGSSVLAGATQAELVSGSNYITASNTQIGFVVSGVAQMSAGNGLWSLMDGITLNTEGGGSKMVAINPYNGPNGGGDGATFFSFNLAPANVLRVDGYGMMLAPMSQPSSPNEGQMYVDNSSGNHLYIYLNGNWNLII